MHRRLDALANRHRGRRDLRRCSLLRGAAAAHQRRQPRPGSSITLYSGQHEQTTDGLAIAFEKQTGITVNVRNDDEDTLANLIVMEGRTPGRSTPRTRPRSST